jgi:hypothetical protein
MTDEEWWRAFNEDMEDGALCRAAMRLLRILDFHLAVLKLDREHPLIIE